MTLVLTIENETSLPNGAPISVRVNEGSNLDIGRGAHLDWTLPDPSRFISGKHCEVRYRDGSFWLYDVSTNGTFLNDNARRIQAPHRLEPGDRFAVGTYVIAVSIDETPVEPRPPTAWPHRADEAAPEAPQQSDVALHAGPEAGLLADAEASELAEEPAADILDDIAGDFEPDEPWSDAPAPAEPAVSAFQEPAYAEATDAPPAAEPAIPLHGRTNGAVADEPEPAIEPPPVVVPPTQPQSLPPVSAFMAPAAASQPPSAMAAAPAPQPAPEPEPRPAASDIDAFLQRFAAGAGITDQIFARQDPLKVAEDLGVLMRMVAENMTELLNARFKAKRFSRTANQTMIQALDNNPLKFAPNVEDAMRIMFGPRSRSYLDAKQSLEAAFSDLKTHQIKTFSAMQQAVKMLVEDLDPAEIDTAAGADKGLLAFLSSRKARLWDLFLARWKAVTMRHQDGMTDAFMLYFAESYDRANEKS